MIGQLPFYPGQFAFEQPSLRSFSSSKQSSIACCLLRSALAFALQLLLAASYSIQKEKNQENDIILETGNEYKTSV